MEGEIKNFILVWTSAILSLYYCNSVSKIVPKGLPRLISIFPVICLFVILPLHFLTSFHLGYSTVFCLSWIANFKLLLLSFGTGPLSNPSLPLSYFLIIASLPINVAQKNTTNDVSKQRNEQHEEVEKSPTSNVNTKNNGLKSHTHTHYAIKAMLLPSIFFLYAYRESINPKMLITFYIVDVYLALEVVLGLCAIIVQSLLGVELEQPFDQPLLSTSLGNYWGKRWNLISTDVLRLTIFRPIYRFFSNILGRTWAWIFAIMGTFLVSGLMHELINYHIFRTRSNWYYTYFFLMHGLCVVIEGHLKKKFGDRWQPPRVVVAPVITVFVMTTFAWLVMTEVLEKNVDAIVMKEYVVVCEFLMSFVGLEESVMPLVNRVFGTSW